MNTPTLCPRSDRSTRILVLAIALWSFPHGFTQSADPGPADDQPCVLLKNDRVLFGTARQVGEHVVIQLGSGSEVKLPRTEIACWADSIRNLYRYRVDRRQPDDIIARLSDASWCLDNELCDLARLEIAAVRQLDPQHRQLKSLEHRLDLIERSRQAIDNSVVAAGWQSPVDSSADSSISVAPLAAATDVGPPGAPPTSLDFGGLKSFTRHVQPMLVNRCGRCHNQESSLAWRLNVPAGGARASAKTSRTNLASTLQFVDRQVPEQSELLRLATTPHGGAGAPLGPRNLKAIAAFKRWLQSMTLEADRAGPTPFARSHVRIGEPYANLPETPNSAVVPIAPPVVRHPFAGHPLAKTGPEETPPLSPAKQGEPHRLPPVSNPFDAELFNRKFHPQLGTHD